MWGPLVPTCFTRAFNWYIYHVIYQNWSDKNCFYPKFAIPRKAPRPAAFQERYAYLALEPSADGTMELVVERREAETQHRLIPESWNSVINGG